MSSPTSTSTKPYLIRAIFEWCVDQGFTPYVAVAVDNRTEVPRSYVKDNQIVLNLSPDAVHQLVLGNEFLTCSARFGGVAQTISVPVENVSAVYARENGQGMAFEVGASAVPAALGRTAQPAATAEAAGRTNRRSPVRAGRTLLESNSLQGSPTPVPQMRRIHHSLRIRSLLVPGTVFDFACSRSDCANTVHASSAMTETPESLTERYRRARNWFDRADGLLIAAGAGMGVDSGLPDFRGTSGFWRAYPALGQAGLRFEQIASPHAFRVDPRLAWGFYGHRLQVYRRTVAHTGFAILQAIAERLPQGAAVFTSNVDGQFQRAGFADEWVTECHGSIHWLQCAGPCCQQIWLADEFDPLVDEAALPSAIRVAVLPRCGGLARPNILMFGDDAWLARRSDAQQRHLDAWLSRCSPVGHYRTRRRHRDSRRCGCSPNRRAGPLIRFNPIDPRVGAGRSEGFAISALDGLRQLADALAKAGFLNPQA